MDSKKSNILWGTHRKLDNVSFIYLFIYLFIYFFILVGGLELGQIYS